MVDNHIELDYNRPKPPNSTGETPSTAPSDAVFVVSDAQSSNSSKLSSKKEKNRYCWGKLSKPQFIIFCVLLAIVLFIGIAFAIGYLVLLPILIPKIVYGFLFSTDYKYIDLNKVVLRDIRPTGVDLDLNIYASRLKLPVSFATAELQASVAKPAVLTFQGEASGQVLLELHLKDNLMITGASGTDVVLPNTVVEIPDPKALAVFLNKFGGWLFTQNSTVPPPESIFVIGKADVKVLGITCSNVDFGYNQGLEMSQLFATLAMRALSGGGDTLSKAMNVNNKALMGKDNSPVTQAGEGSPAFADPLAVGPVLANKLNVEVNGNGINVDAGIQWTKKPYFAGIQSKGLGGSLTINKKILGGAAIGPLALEYGKPDFDLSVKVFPNISATDIPEIASVVKRVTAFNFDNVNIGVANLYMKDQNGVNAAFVQTLSDNLDLQVPLKAFQEQIMTFASSPMSTDGASQLLSMFTINDISLDMKVNNTISILPNITMPSFIEAKIDILPFSFDLASDDGIELIHISVGGIGFTGEGNQTIAPAIGIVLSDQVAAADAMGSIFSKALFVQSSIIALGNVKFEPKPGSTEDVTGINQLFEVLRVRVSVDKILFSSVSQSPLISIDSANQKDKAVETNPTKLEPLLNIALGSAAVDVLPNSFVLNFVLDLINKLPVHAKAPYVSLRAGIDTDDFIKLVIVGLGIQPGTQAMNSTATLSFGTNGTLPQRVSDLVEGFLAKTTINNTIVIQGFRLGPNEVDSYGLFDRLNIKIPGFFLSTLPTLLPTLLPGSSNSTDTSVPPKAPLFHIEIPEALKTLSIDSLNPTLNGLDLSSAATSQSVSLAVTAGVKNPLPLSLNCPYFAIDMLTDNNVMVTLEVKNIKLTPGQSTLTPTIVTSFSNSNAVQVSASKLVGGVFAKLIEKKDTGLFGGVKVQVGQLLLGVTNDESIKALSKLKLTIPENIIEVLKEKLKLSNLPPIDIYKIVPWARGLGINSFKPFALQNAAISTQINPDFISLVVAANLNNPLPISIDLPYLQAAIGLTGTKLLGTEIVGLKLVRGAANLALEFRFWIGQDPNLKNKVANLMNRFQNHQGISFEILGAVLSNIQTFNALNLGINISDDLITKLKNTAMSSLPPSDSLMSSLSPLLKGFAVNQIQDLEFVINDEGIKLGVGAVITNPLPIQVDIGYASVDINVRNAGRLAQIQIAGPGTTPGLQLKSGTNPFSLRINTILGVKGAPTTFADAVKSIYDDFMAKVANSDISVGGVLIGQTAVTNFDAFSAVYISIPLPFDNLPKLPIGELSGLVSGLVAGNSTAGFISQVKPTFVEILTTNLGFDINAGISLPALNFNVNIDIGYFAFDLYLQDARIGTFIFKHIKIKRGPQLLTIPMQFVFPPEDPNAPAKIGELVNTLVAKGIQALPPFTVGFGAVYFGGSGPTFNFLSKIILSFTIDVRNLGGTLQSLPIPLPKLPALPSSLPEILALASTFGLKLNKLDIATVETGINIATDIQFNQFGFPITVKFGYLSIDGTLFGRKLATLQVDNLNIIPSGTVESLSVLIKTILIPEDPSTSVVIGSLANPIIQHILTKTNFPDLQTIKAGVRNIYFGSSPSNRWSLLSGINAEATIPLPFLNNITGIIDSLPKPDMGALTAGALNGTAIQLGPLKISAVEIGTGSLGIDAKISGDLASLGFPQVTVFFGFFNIDINIITGGQFAHLMSLQTNNLRLTGGGGAGLLIPGTLNLVNHDDNAPALLNTLVQKVAGFLSGKKEVLPGGDSFLQVSGITFGSDPAHVSKILSKIAVKLDVLTILNTASGLLTSLPATLPSGSVGLSQLKELAAKFGLVLNKLDIATVDTGINIAANLQFNQIALPITIKFGYLSIDGTMFGAKLATIEVENFNVIPENGIEKVSVLVKTILLPEDPSTSVIVGSFANPIIQHILAKTNFPSLQILKAGVRNIWLGSSRTAKFDLFSKISAEVSIPLPFLNNITGIIDSFPKPDLGGLLSGALNKTSIEIGPLKINAVEIGTGALVATVDTGIDIATDLQFNQIILPITIKMGYFSIDGTLYGAKLATIEVENFNVIPENGIEKFNVIVKSILLPEDPSISTVIGNLANPIIDHILTNTNFTEVPILKAGVRNIWLGSSSTAKFDLFSKVNAELSLPLTFLKNIPGLLASLPKPDLGAIAGGINSTSIQLGPLKLTGLDFQTGSLGIDAKISGDLSSLGFPQVSLYFGYFNLDIDIQSGSEGAHLMSVQSGNITLSGAGGSGLVIPGLLNLVNRADNAPALLNTLLNKVAAFITGKTEVIPAGNSFISVTGITFGSKPEHAAKLLSKIAAKMDVLALILKAKELLKSSVTLSTAAPTLPGIQDLITKFGLKLTKLELATVESGVDLNVGVQFNQFGCPITLKIGHFAVDLTLFHLRLLTLEVDNFNIIPSGTIETLSIMVKNKFIPEDPNLANTIAMLVNPIIKNILAKQNFVGPQAVIFGLRGVWLGPSAESRYDLFSKIDVEVSIPLPFLNNIVGIMDSLPKPDLGAIAAGALNSTAIQMGPLKVTGLDLTTGVLGFDAVVTASLSALPGLESVALTLGYFNIDFNVISTNPAVDSHLASLQSGNIKLSGAGGSLSLPATFNLANHGPEAPEVLRVTVNKVVAYLMGQKDQLPAGDTFFVVTGITFGSDAAHLATLFSKIAVQLDVNLLLGFLEGILGPIVGNVKAQVGAAAANPNPSNLLSSLPFTILNVAGGFNDESEISLNLAIKLKNPLPLAVNINLGYMGIDGAVSNMNTFGTFSLNNVIVKPDGSASLTAKVAFVNNLEVANSMYYLYACVMASGCRNNLPVLQNIRVGKSPSETLDLLSKISVTIPVNVDITAIRGGKVTIPPGLESLFSISADIRLVASGITGAIDLKVNPGFPLDLNFGWFKIAAQYNAAKGSPLETIAKVQLTNLRVSSAANQVITLNIDIPVNPVHLPLIINSILAVPMVSIPAQYFISGLELGVSPQKPIVIFSQIPVFLFIIQSVVANLKFDIKLPLEIKPSGFSLLPKLGLKIDVNNGLPVSLHTGAAHIFIGMMEDKGAVTDMSIDIYNLDGPKQIDLNKGPNRFFTELHLKWALAWHIIKNLFHLGSILKKFIIFGPKVDGLDWLNVSLDKWSISIWALLEKFPLISIPGFTPKALAETAAFVLNPNSTALAFDGPINQTEVNAVIAEVNARIAANPEFASQPVDFLNAPTVDPGNLNPPAVANPAPAAPEVTQASVSVSALPPAATTLVAATA
ncbi:hypothetical protein HDU92_004665 [Lobulomyces angularis]|nr:hypothetical protein HDU92_004665 [Lobulomyces angularis]